jgi:hypothetical protein
MTTDELERDLEALAEPRADDERLRLAIRTALGEQLHSPPRSRRRGRLVLGSMAAAAAALAVVIVAVIGTGGSSSADAAVIAHIVRASSPPANMIVHVSETGVLPDGTPVVVEWWQDTNPPYALRMIKGTAAQPRESGADGTTYSWYDTGTNTIYQQPEAAPPTLVDPIETLRAGLENGTAQIAATVTINGRSLYRIELPNGVVGYFDKSDYRPVYIDNPQHDGSVVRTEVTAYDELPISPANEQLLSVTAQHPDARVVQGQAPAPTKPPTAPK